MSTVYEPVIGLEVHVQLATQTKLFCGCRVEFGAEPNLHTCPVCLGLPGSLPVLNYEALRLGIKAGLALNCEITGRLKFDRKNYFYPDLPKAYQISQYDMPVNRGGFLEIELGDRAKTVRITRAHLEEDAGKLLHEGIKDGTLVDYNRAGTPLLEIVSEPDIGSPDEAYAYLTALKAVLQYTGVSECNMEQGSLRCDANVSIRPQGSTKLGTKTEIKNLNSFRAVQKAIQYEIERQTQALESGERIAQETRLWNDMTGKTLVMRSKEEAHDYRYFPEPDLVPFTLERKKIDEIRATLPELPRQRTERFMAQCGLSRYDASVLVEEKKLGDYFEACLKAKASPKMISNWIQSELLALLNQHKRTIEDCPVKPEALSELVALIENNTISGKIAKDVLPAMFETGKSAKQIVEEKGLQQVTDVGLIEAASSRIIEQNPKSVADFKAGKSQALGYLVGQVMKETKGKANPKLVNEILQKQLS